MALDRAMCLTGTATQGKISAEAAGYQDTSLGISNHTKQLLHQSQNSKRQETNSQKQEIIDM